LKRVPFILVAGDREMEAGELAVRTREGKDLGSHSLDALSASLSDEIASRGKRTVSSVLSPANAESA